MQSIARSTTRLAGAAALVGALALPATAAEPAVEPDAETVMRAMADYFGGLESFSVRYETDGEIIDGSGEKLMFVSNGEIAMQRPDKLRASRQNVLTELAIVYDGETVSIVAEAANAYFQMAAPGTFDDAITAVRADLHYDFPGADLLYSDVYASLMGNVTSGRHLGMAVIGGVEVHHLAFRTDTVDWQLWVTAGDRPLPLRYVITSKWVTGAPQYTARLSDWTVSPELDPALFSYTPPADARRVEQIRINAIGEIEEVK